MRSKVVEQVMRLLIVFQKNWGKRIMENIAMNAPGDWHIESHIMPAFLPLVMDEPEDFLPDSLPDVDLLLSLGESTGVAELIPDFVEMTGAEAVIAPVDNRLWLPRGLQNQIQRKLEAIGVEAVFPTPFCSLVSKYSDNRHIRSFTEKFGRPSLEISRQEHGKNNGKILKINLLRDSPCGNARFVVEKLTGRDVHGAPEEGALLHQYYPCLASVDMIHKSAFIAAGAVSRALKT